MTTDKQLQDLFNQLNRFFPVTTQGGKVGDRLWIKVNGKRVQATCHHNIKSGECLAVLADDGEYYLVRSEVGGRRSEATRVIQVRRTKPPIEKVLPPNFKVLFSVVEGGVRKFFVGGDRPTPLQILELPSTATIQQAYITNFGDKPKFEVAIAYQLSGETFSRYANIVNGSTYNFSSQLLKAGNSYYYKGAATWVSEEQSYEIFYASANASLNGVVTRYTSRSTTFNNQKINFDYSSGTLFGLSNETKAYATTITFELKETTTLIISGSFTSPPSVTYEFIAFGINKQPTGNVSGIIPDPGTSDYYETDSAATYEVELTAGSYYIGFLYQTIGFDGGVTDLPMVGYFDVESDALLEKNFYINKTSESVNVGTFEYVPTDKLLDSTDSSFYDLTVDNSLFLSSGVSNLDFDRYRNGSSPNEDNFDQINASFLILRGSKSFIREQLSYTNYPSSSLGNKRDKTSNYYLGTKLLKADIGMCINQAIALDLSTTSVSVTVSSSILFAYSYNYTLEDIFASLIGQPVLLAKNNYLGKGIIDDVTTDGVNLTIDITVNSVTAENFISFTSTTGRIILDSQSLLQYLLLTSASSTLQLNETLFSFYNTVFNIGYPTATFLLDGSGYVGDRLKTDNLVKSKIFISQINEDMKEEDITGYAEVWNIDGDGNFVRQDAPREGLIYSLGNAGATIHSISYWASK